MGTYLYLFRRTWSYLDSQAILLKTAWKYAGNQRLMFTLSILTGFAAEGLMLTTTYFLGRTLNAVQAGGPQTLRNVFLSLLAVFAVRISFWILHWIERYLEQSLGAHIARNFRRDLYAKLSSFPLSWHRERHSARLINEIQTASRSLQEFTSKNFENIEMLMRFFGSIAILTALDAAIGITAVIVASFLLVSSLLFTKEYARVKRKIIAAESRVASALQDYLANITTIISLRIRTLTQLELDRRLEDVIPLESRKAAVNETKWFANDTGIALMKLALTTYYCWATLQEGQPLLAGTVGMVFLYLGDIEKAFSTFNKQYGQAVSQRVDVESVDYILREAATQKAAETGSLPTDWHEILLSNLRFGYRRNGPIRHVTGLAPLRIAQGERLAVTGESGSGKTTLLKLLRGLENASAGQARAGGKHVSLSQVQGMTAYIPQEPEIFENTIEYNITLGMPVEKRLMVAAMEAACFDTVVAGLPRGIKSHISERGVNLSGGEKQRLALARGILFAEHSDIILLDEPTSSIDYETELMIYENIFSHFKGKTVVSVVHKLHLLSMFNRIYSFEGGVLVEKLPSLQDTLDSRANSD